MTDTDKWKKPFVKSLPIELKLLWFYLLDDCDHAGIWHVDFEVAEIRIGVKIDPAKAQQFFGDKVVVFDNGLKWFIPSFISFQYGEFTPKNKLFNTVSSQLSKYNLMGHLSPIYGGKEKEQEKEKEKEQEIQGNGKTEETAKLPTNPYQHLDILYPVDHCAEIASKDETWVSKSGFNEKWRLKFRDYLTATGETEKKLLDYKKHFYNWKKKQPEEAAKPKMEFR